MVFCLVKKCFLVSLLLVFALGSLVTRWLGNPSQVIASEWTEADKAGRIPSKIWQVDPWGSKVINGNFVQSWITRNIGFSYTLMTPESADIFVRRHFTPESRVRRVYEALQSPSLKCDLMRFILLMVEGGIYTDLDTQVVKPVDDWIPRPIQERVKAIVGIEYDQLFDRRIADGMFFPIQFCQWTVAGTRGHPLFRRMVNAMVEAIERLAEDNDCSIQELRPSEDDVLQTTGPGRWSRCVFEYLSEATNSLVDHQPFKDLQLPRLYDDVMILPIDGFATGVPHSNASLDDSDSTLIRHNFRGTWRNDIQVKEVEAMRPGAHWSMGDFGKEAKR